MGEILLGMYLGISSVTDWRKRAVSMKLSLGFFAAGAMLQIWSSPLSWEVWLGGIALGILLLGVSRITREALGYGDSVAVIVTGCWLGLWENMALFCTALGLSAMVSAVLLVSGRKGRKESIPFLPFLFAAYGFLFLVPECIQTMGR